MERLTEWITSKFQHPLSLPFFLLGVLLILLGLTTGFQLPVLQQLAIAPNYRNLALVMGVIFVLLSVLFTIAQELSQSASELIRRLVELAAVIAGISGLVISNLRIINPVLFYSALGLLVILSISILLSRQQMTHVFDKTDIDNIWQLSIMSPKNWTTS